MAKVIKPSVARSRKSGTKRGAAATVRARIPVLSSPMAMMSPLAANVARKNTAANPQSAYFMKFAAVVPLDTQSVNWIRTSRNVRSNLTATRMGS